MRKISAIVFAVISALGISSAYGAAYLDTGSTTYTPGPNDISQLSPGVASSGTDGLNYYTDQHYAGQSFTTGSNVAGYELASFSLTFGDPDAPSPTFTGAVGTITGTTFAPIDSETYTTTGSITKNDWVTFTPSNPIVLLPNTTYAYDLHNTTSGWDGPNAVSGNPYAGGQVLLVDNATNTQVTYGSTGAYDATFDVALTPVPEPASIGLLAGLGAMLLRRRRR